MSAPPQVALSGLARALVQHGRILEAEALACTSPSGNPNDFLIELIKRGLMSVKYSLLWLLLAVALVIAAAFPYVIYVLRDVLSIEMPVNLVFLLMFCFVLVVLLSLSIAITQLAEKCKRLTQANAILEKRVRDLEEKNR